jgi:hypothetical protein
MNFSRFRKVRLINHRQSESDAERIVSPIALLRRKVAELQKSGVREQVHPKGKPMSKKTKNAEQLERAYRTRCRTTGVKLHCTYIPIDGARLNRMSEERQVARSLLIKELLAAGDFS